MTRRSVRLSLISALVLLGGCDLFGGEEDGTIVITGTVVFAETGAPIEGVAVALDEIVGISHVFVETVRTDTEGRFTLIYEATESFG